MKPDSYTYIWLARKSPDSGSIMVTGHDVGQLIDGALAEFRLKITGWMFLPESFALLTDALGLRTQGRSIAEAGTAARAPVKVVQLEEQAHHRGCEMLGGEPPLIALARALAKNPRLLLADQPTGHLDSGTAVGHASAPIGNPEGWRQPRGDSRREVCRYRRWSAQIEDRPDRAAVPH